MDNDRYRVTVSSAGRPAISEWWSREEVARGKFRDWAGQCGGLPDVRVTLCDEETGVTLTEWPEEA
ncbi:hypothetical protein OOK44_28040 [Streptomyces cellulosae]|uniref:hypothetical protein n=1 Tax=Streptomyces TaxID=1883 RepID=UPI00224F8071|nr:hypothetical protein [Streptomyces sp. OS603R]MCX4480262.1 hypothetical protein [Streptomyces cellulosae]WTC55051.1 hypothetical protein OH715_07075 [Streptomyces cellulosae]